MVSVELDLDDMEPVPMTKARALGLQAELYLRLSDPQFQGRLAALRAECGDDLGKFQMQRQDLLYGIQREVLPKYGYDASRQGLTALRKGLEEFADDPLIQASREVISRSVGVPANKGSDAEVHEEDWVALFTVPDSAPSSPQVVQFGQARSRSTSPPPAESQEELWRRSKAEAEHELREQWGVPVELDLDDVKVPLTRDRALALQHELMDQFSDKQFQERLRALEAKFSHDLPEFRKERMHLAMEVQGKILPKYGYEGSLVGVANMLHDLDEKFPADKELHDNTKVVDRLLLGDHPASKASPRGPRASAAAQPPTAGHGDAEEKHRRPHPVSVVTDKEGFWEVVGGRRSGGLLVRLGEDMHSPAFHELLTTGSVIKEVTRVGERMNYEKVTGDGPNYGWISMHLHGHELLKHYSGEVPIIVHH